MKFPKVIKKTVAIIIPIAIQITISQLAKSYQYGLPHRLTRTGMYKNLLVETD